LASAIDTQSDNYETLVLYIADYTYIADSIPPVTSKITRQGPSPITRGLQCEKFVQIAPYTFTIFIRQGFKFLSRF